MPYYREQPVPAPFDDALDRVRAALAEQGWAIPAEIDVTDAFQNALGKDFRRYVILLTGDPEAAYDAMTQDPNIGVLMPTNIAVYEADGSSVVVAMEPELLDDMGIPHLEQTKAVLHNLISDLFPQIT